MSEVSTKVNNFSSNHIDEAALNSILISKVGGFNIRRTGLTEPNGYADICWNYKDEIEKWIWNAVFTNTNDLEWLFCYGMDSKVTSIVYTLLQGIFGVIPNGFDNNYIKLTKEDTSNYINMTEKSTMIGNEKFSKELKNHYYVKHNGSYKKVYEISNKNNLIKNTFDCFKKLYGNHLEKMKVFSNQASGNYIIPLYYFYGVITYNMSFTSFYTGKITFSDHIERLNYDKNYKTYILYCIIAILNGEPLDKRTLLSINYNLQTIDEKRKLAGQILDALSKYYEGCRRENFYTHEVLKIDTDLLLDMHSKVREYKLMLNDSDFQKNQTKMENLVLLKDFKEIEKLIPIRDGKDGRYSTFWSILLNLRLNYKSNVLHKLKA